MATMAERLLPLPRLTIDDQLRFWSKVSGYGSHACWLWTASKYDNRYGRFSYAKGSYCAHMVSYFLKYNVDPAGFLVCHSCNIPLCVNPDHLYLGTNQENIQQSYDENRHNQLGSLNPAARLQESDIPIIRERHRKGEGYILIAKSLGVTHMTIKAIIDGRTWRHVP